MTDDEARQLPIELDAATLRAFGSSTWMTDSGPIDVLRELRDRQGRDVPSLVIAGTTHSDPRIELGWRHRRCMSLPR
jgi:hypothetical protein